MRCLRTADQFVHTGLEKADEAHQEAHVLLEKWEKFAIKLDQRRKLLSIVVSFFKQAEEANERLSQIENNIRIENERVLKMSESKRPSDSRSSPSFEMTQRQVELQNQLAEITAPGLREGKIVLEKIAKEDFEAEQVIRKVYEFTEHVNELKNKLVIFKFYFSIDSI